MPLERETAHHGGDVCELCVLLAKSFLSLSFCSCQNKLRCYAGYRIIPTGADMCSFLKELLAKLITFLILSADNV
jgi:hypothetical protein